MLWYDSITWVSEYSFLAYIRATFR